MTHERSAHLSEEAMNDVLIGMGSPESADHLAVCAVCADQVNAFHSRMRSYNQATLAWSEARAIRRPMAASQPGVRRAVAPPLAWALAAALLLIFGFTAWNHHHPASWNRGPVTASNSQDSEAQIAEDNALLRSVDIALNEDEEQSIREYHLLEAPHPHPRNRPELRKP